MNTIVLYNGKIFTGVALMDHNTVIIKDGLIEDVVSNERFTSKDIPKGAEVYDMNGAVVSPGFIDTHIHGIKGYDTSDNSVDAIHGMSEALVEHGCTSFCPTMYPQEQAQFLKGIKAISDAMGNEPGAEILGHHLEGPFVSRDKHGALDVDYMQEVNMDLMRKYWETSQEKIAIMTVAPELKNMRELALFGTKKGIVLSAGHSDATYENMVEGMQAGILHSTHFFNAMRRLHHRDPGVVGGIMIHPNVSCEVIADGHHVHPAIIKLLLRVKPIHKIVMVTDALRPTCQTSGKLLANGEEVYYSDGLFKKKSDDTIAGSALTMIKGVQYLNEIGVPMEDSLRMAACNPATIVSRQFDKGYIIPGKAADITVFDKDFKVKLVMIKGVIKKNNL
ncbi:MAG: N-acetylglucosamine-6-phosphate deacetylase [Candidatus Marinimicrobia bacterium]|nr:N-acetylglucosamine-6-phosphate deacetylase [Candidatus Neomarinimicrobiota bacterium]